MRNMLTIVCALAILVWAGQALGVAPSNYNFTNAGGDSLWMNPANWLAEDATTGIPNDYEDDNAWIGGGLTAKLIEPSASGPQCATPKRLRLGISDGTAGTLEIHSSHLNLRLGWAGYAYIGNNGAGFGAGHVIQYGGALSTCGMGLGSNNDGVGTYDLQGGSVMAFGGCGIAVGGGTQKSNGLGIITQTGGTLTLTSTSSAAVIALAYTSNWKGDMHDCTGSYTISGGTLNTYGNTSVAGGIAIGPRDYSDPAKLCTGNSGTFHVIGAWDDGVDNIQVNSFAMRTFGTDNEAILVCDIDGTVGIEKIVVNHAAEFAGTLTVNTLGSGHTGTYTLMTYDSATGDFVDGTNLPIGWTYNIGATELTVTVPEPATLTLLGLGGLGVLIRRKRR